ncbi:helix-turn-helix domain-containing protein [Planomonospora sp. ID82291]|uniref:helix-turn-helix domain-containing protein n=1 Tax=Planomonospora sp. ID82291 TaxID=2738136 RepID=UPI0018C37834|nr:helix-turn-helix domain-containing protein [Planomonospora sp. ID82291]MBG0818720.1 helix-turn-helix domain-containing protein [Planomonospora sp. ID82291]
MPLTTFQVGARLRRARQAAGLTEQEAAARAGMDTARLWRLEEGRAYPTLPTLVRLAPVLGISIDHLAGLAIGPQQPDLPGDGQVAAPEQVTRPRIVVDPAVNSGKPTITAANVPVAAVISGYLAGERLEDLYGRHEMDRAALLVCCWWVARYAKQRKAWKQWLETWEPVLCAIPVAYDEVPLPPRRLGPAFAPVALLEVGYAGGQGGQPVDAPPTGPGGERADAARRHPATYRGRLTVAE